MTTLYGQSVEGVGRVQGDSFELLEVGGATLGEIIEQGRPAILRDAPVIREVAADAVTFVQPLSRPGKFVIVGLNYADHAREIGATQPEYPRFSYVPGSALAGPFDSIALPEIAPDEVDYEGELAVVIGKRASSVSRDVAWEHVAGLTVANDVSARDVQLGRHPATSGPNVGLGKAFDTFKPVGPTLLLTAGEESEATFSIETVIDGEVRQRSRTSEMFFDVPELIATISAFCVLEPGDVILTGTPGGVAESDGRYLRAGQTVAVTVAGIGTIENTVVSPR